MQRRRELAIALVALLALHAGALGLLWTAGGDGPAQPEPATVGPDADARTLLAAAIHNSATFAWTAEVRLRDAANGTTRLHLRTAADPAAARLQQTVVEAAPGDGGPAVASDAYLTPWGRWLDRGDGWRYLGRSGEYDADAARLLGGVPGTETPVRANRTDAVVRITVPRAPATGGLLSIAGTNATHTYTVAFRGSVPYVERARALPADGELTVSLRRRPGASVSRPEAIGGLTPAELLDRLVEGRRYV